MKIIRPSVELIKPSGYTLDDAYKHIEKCAKVCYKSEAKITDSSAYPFVQRLIKAGHTAMLEFGTVYLTIPDKVVDKDYALERFINLSDTACLDWDWDVDNYDVATNLRYLRHAEMWTEDLLQYLDTPNTNHPKRVTLKFITSIGIVRELIRHRHFSFANESTRYCNYSKDKFNNEVSFVEPYWMNNAKKPFLTACEEAEGYYLDLLEAGCTPQEAREVLPLSTKSELCMCGFVKDWKHFFDLRLHEITGKVHPDMKILAQMAYDKIQDYLI